MKSIIDSIALGPGVITYNDFFLREDLPLEEQEELLKEDMFQVEFPGGTIVDVGWVPSFDYRNGKFQVRTVKNYDWDCPVYFRETRSLSVMREFLMEAIKLALA